jgi:DNA topoisomerase IB
MPVWRTLSHNGVAFPDPYLPRGLSIRVSGQEVKLSPLAEEMAYQFAKKKDTPYVQDSVFVANFMKYFVKQLPPTVSSQSKFEDFDFSQFYRLVDQEKMDKETMTKEAKKSLAASRKEKRERLREVYGKALLDGKEIEVANWMAEPPGLFMGRGAHPLRGSWKPRVSPPDVTLNLGEDAPSPPGEWGEVVHDHESIWIARWIDKLTEKEKYVWPHESSDIQQSRNKEKYDKALRIGERLPRLQAAIRKKMDDRDEKVRKVATVCCLIDEVGMRVGDEKDEDEADTVGATTLRVEHIKRLDDQAIEFDFLGKDSVSGDAELYYRLDGQLGYATFEELLKRVAQASYSKDSEGRELIVPLKRLEVLTASSLDQRKAKIEWGVVTEIITHEVRKPMFELSLAGGRQIRVTGDHSLFKIDQRSRYNAVAAPVHRMSTKDSIATVSCLPVGLPDRLVVDSVPLTDDLLTYCGLWLADGCYGEKAVMISAGGDVEVLSFVQSFSASYSGKMMGFLHGSDASVGMAAFNNYQKARARSTLAVLEAGETAFGFRMNAKGDIWCHSIALVRLLQSLRLSGYAAEKDFPEWVHSLSDRQIGRLLRGYFSGDGCVPSDDGSIRASSSSRKLLEHARVLLLRLGIDSTIHRSDSKTGFKRSGPGWVLAIRRNDSKRMFLSSVGLLQKEKTARVKFTSARYRRFPLAWRKVRKITPVKCFDRVYDLSVEGTQRFVANGLLAHNSVRWVKRMEAPDPALVRNMRKFMAGKRPDKEIFDGVTSSHVNSFLSSIVDGLSAKVFRTYHATKTVEESLAANDVSKADDFEKLRAAKLANLDAAIYCNHKRTIPKTWEASLEKKKQKLAEYRAAGKEQRVKKMQMDIDLTERTKEYNLNTSMKNYIDPRIYKAWCDYVGLDWSKLYSKSLQRKFSWVAQSKKTWPADRPAAAGSVPNAGP